MHKIFFGTIVFFSLAFLAACGGGGGSAGSTGATGADGAAGTIAVPSADSDLAISAGLSADSDYDLGQVGTTFNLSGLDNLTADSRVRYYGYFGTSSTTKTVPTAAGSAGYQGTNSVGIATPIDTRVLASGADNITLTLTANYNIGAGDGLITHVMFCPGNEAGDATSCASGVILDRGFGALGTWATDNVTRVFIDQDAKNSPSAVTTANDFVAS
jgi:hypothetical protein